MSVGVVMIDGTKVKANASMDQNRSYSGLVREILREAEETDRREDELYGDTRGDELPERMRTAEGRKAALEDAKRRSRSKWGDDSETSMSCPRKRASRLGRAYRELSIPAFAGMTQG